MRVRSGGLINWDNAKISSAGAETLLRLEKFTYLGKLSVNVPLYFWNYGSDFKYHRRRKLGILIVIPQPNHKLPKHYKKMLG